MKLPIHRYVLGVFAAAVFAAAGLYSQEPVLPDQYLRAALVFGSIALLARLLRHRTGKETQSSIAFIPVLASATVAPHWITMVVGVTAALTEQLISGKGWQKTTFNASQYALSLALGIMAYKATGGEPLQNIGQSTAISLIALFLVFLLVNSGSVSGAVAITRDENPLEVWKTTTLVDLPYDFLSLPVVLFFVWMYSSYGAAGAFFVAVPLLGVRQLYIVNSRLERTNRELLELMVAAIEARDPYTSGHSRRVASNAKIIAKAIGLGQRDIERIGVAALLHDVGKIHDVFGPILSKPGRLTAEENTIMKTHPIKSEELASNVSELKDLLPMIRHHHENWDGTGYPDGIAGEEVPLGSRIIMFADTIDAMTTDRPYRAALGEAAVRKELERFRGSQFDPAIYDVLLVSPHFRLLFGTEKKAGGSTPSLHSEPVLTISR